MQHVKQVMRTGLSFSAALKGLLETEGLSITALAAEFGVPREDLSAVLNLRRKPTDQILQALSSHFGGSREEWLELWRKAIARSLK